MYNNRRPHPHKYHQKPYDIRWYFLTLESLIASYLWCYMMLYAVYVMLFPVFWRPVGFSTYIFGGDPLYPPTHARARFTRACALAEIWLEDFDPKTGGRHNGERQRGTTTGPDRSAWPPVNQTQKGWKKKSYEIFLCLDDFRCGHKKIWTNLIKLVEILIWYQISTRMS